MHLPTGKIISQLQRVDHNDQVLAQNKQLYPVDVVRSVQSSVQLRAFSTFLQQMSTNFDLLNQ